MIDALRTGDDAFTAGLRGYTASVAAALGVGLESSHLETDERAVVYLALDHRLAGFPGHDVALLWDEELGWSVVVETAAEPVVVAVVGDDLVPEPAVVARCLETVAMQPQRPVAARRRSADRGELGRRLSRYVMRH
ncbi:MAG: DUF6292 family protein [Kibdelosporangium sp.]